MREYKMPLTMLQKLHKQQVDISLAYTLRIFTVLFGRLIDVTKCNWFNCKFCIHFFACSW